MIGSYDLDLTSVYFSYQHEMYRVWMTLTDPEDIREGTQGYLQAEIAVLGPGDQMPVHNIETEQEPVRNKR